MKARNLFIIFLVSMMLFIPTNTKAANKNYSILDGVQILDAVTEAQEARKKEEQKSYETTQETLKSQQIQQESEDMTHLCEDENFISLIKLIRTIIYVLIYAAAAVLIIRGVLIFVGTITSDKVELDKAFKTFGSKLILGVVVIILPSLFNWVFFSDNIFVQQSTYYKTCVNKISDGKFFPELSNEDYIEGGKGDAGSSSGSPSKTGGSTSSQKSVAN